eukprot:1161596-Pelagomonas_calceolata.AAC.4
MEGAIVHTGQPFSGSSLLELEDAIAEKFEPQEYQLLSRASDASGEYRAFAFVSSLGEKPDITE